MGHKRLTVNFRGREHALRVCMNEERVTDTLARWDGGVIQLERIYAHESPSTLEQRSLIVERVCERAGVALRLDPKLPRAEAVRSAFHMLPDVAQAHPVPDPELDA